MPEIKEKVELTTSDCHLGLNQTFDQENDACSERLDPKFAANNVESSMVPSGLEIVPVNENQTNNTSNTSNSIASQDCNCAAVACENGFSKARENSNGGEGDLVLANIESWPPNVSQHWRRRSCEMTKSVSPCIRKVTSHLHQLQDIIDRVYQFQEEDLTDLERPLTSASESSSLKESEEELKESEVIEDRASTRGQSSASSHGHRIKWFLSSASLETIGEEFERDSRSRLQSSASGAVLEVRGHSVASRLLTSASSHSSKRTDAKSESEVARCYTILREVLSLINRIESDRLATEQALAREGGRVLTLHNEIDRHAYKRMYELPAAVQREHEACAIDINELRWHCAYRGRVEVRISEKVRQAEIRNAKLKHDLINIQKHCPLVEEKFDLEGEAMSSIQDKQDETDFELRQTLERLAATEQKTAEANGKAAQERLMIKQDVDVDRNELNVVSDELAQLKMYFTSNIHTMNDIRSALAENTEQAMVLEGREERIKALDATQSEKVQRIRDKIEEQEKEHQKLVEENSNLFRNKGVAKITFESDISKLEFQIKSAAERSRELTARNKTLVQDKKVIKQKIEQKAKQRIADEKSIARANQEVIKVLDQIKVSEDETKKVEVLHASLKENLTGKREVVLVMEESLKTTADSVKKSLKDEAHARTVLQARIASDSSELAKTQDESKKKRDKAKHRAEEINRLVLHVREQVSKLEKIHKERQQTVTELNKIIEKVSQQHREMESGLRESIDKIRPTETRLKKENLELAKKIDHMTWKSQMMDRKMQGMDSSSSMMNKVLAVTTEEIATLNEDISELTIQLETGSETERDLKTILEQTKVRFETRKTSHDTHMTARRSALTTNQKGVEDALNENRNLASQYDRLQTVYLRDKSSLLKALEKRVNEEGRVKDLRELNVLQGRMREVLQQYYKLRNLQNKAELAEFELRTVANGEKLTVLQREMMRVIEHINRFLQANNAAHGTISAEAAKIAQSPLTSATVA